MRPKVTVTIGLTILLVGCAPKAVPTANLEPPPASASEVACRPPAEFSDATSDSERRVLRSRALNEMTARWRGRVRSELTLPEELADALETALLNDPEQIEAFARRDYDACVALLDRRSTVELYLAEARLWLDQLSEQGCRQQNFSLISQNLDVGRRWQVDLPVCHDQILHIEAVGGLYTIRYQGDDAQSTWLGPEGDVSRPPAPGDPCVASDCHPGQVIGRFVNRDGKARVFPIGRELTFTVPEHGTLSFAINDDDLADNRFRVVDKVQDYLRIDISPARSAGSGGTEPVETP